MSRNPNSLIISVRRQDMTLKSNNSKCNSVQLKTCGIITFKCETLNRWKLKDKKESITSITLRPFQDFKRLKKRICQMKLTRFTGEAFSTAGGRKPHNTNIKKHFSSAAASEYKPAFSSWTTGYYELQIKKSKHYR